MGCAHVSGEAVCRFPLSVIGTQVTIHDVAPYLLKLLVIPLPFYLGSRPSPDSSPGTRTNYRSRQEAYISTPASSYPYLHAPTLPRLYLHTCLWRESGLQEERSAKGKARPFNRPALPPIVYVRMSCSCSGILPAA